MRYQRRVGNSQVAVAYLRVSTEDQKLGPEAQRAAIDAWGAREHVLVASWHGDDGVSGGSELDARPGLLGALESVRESGAGVLVVAKRDRLARDVYVAATLERAVRAAGARIACADGVANGDTPADAFLRTILDGAAEYERGLIRARTKAALAAKRARGERVGAIPFGYRIGDDGRTLEIESCEQAVIARVREMRGSGLSLRAIVQQCGLVGLHGRSGRPLNKTQVERILARGLFEGDDEWKVM
jgi:site-specific DNA recombinase